MSNWRSTRFLLPFIVVLILFVSFFRLGIITLFDVDEAVFAEATKEMVKTGDFITPTYNGVNRYDKPILFYWAMAASYKAFGINEFAARVPSAVAGVLLALSLFFFVKRFLGDKYAVWSTVSFVLSIFFFIYSHAAVTDMLLTLLITLSLFCFYIFDSADLRDTHLFSFSARNISIYGFYLFSALAFLTKGLIGIVFPFGIAIIYLMIARGLKAIKMLFNIKGIVLFIIISGPWYGAQLAINGMEFVDQFFIKHHFARYMDVNSGHSGPFYYFIPVLLCGFFPWIVFLPSGVKTVIRESNLFALIKTIFDNKKEKVLNHTESESVGLFALVWFAVIFLFFSFSTTKLPNYILPSIPGVAILVSIGLSKHDKLEEYSYAVLAMLSFVVGIVIFFFSRKYLSKIGFYDDTTWTLGISFLMFGMIIVSLYRLVLKKSGFFYMAILMTIFLTIFSISVLPIINNYLQGTLYRYSLYAKLILSPNEKIIVYDLNKPSILFYSDHNILPTKTKDDIIHALENKTYAIVITKTKHIKDLEKLGLKILKNEGDYALLEKK
ncbi:MAG: ArnT family glycosyltransferase [Dissulfurimicrobium sp.]|uniref:ArnT family glycosyltransferase n=1 Tax=Dissulfurimicrobium sp. TaxID=2022436 RepID=UPI00404915A5